MDCHQQRSPQGLRLCNGILQRLQFTLVQIPGHSASVLGIQSQNIPVRQINAALEVVTQRMLLGPKSIMDSGKPETGNAKR